MTKKLISILLAAIMVMSTFTVAAFANDAESESTPNSYIYCSTNHSGHALVTQKMVADSEGKLEATKLYPGDTVDFHLDTTKNIEIAYDPNGGFSTDDRSSNPLSQYSTKKHTVLGMGDTITIVTDSGSTDRVLNFAHMNGKFLYWVITDVVVSGNSYKATFSAVWEISEADDETEEPTPESKFEEALAKVRKALYDIFINPFYAFLKLYNEVIRLPFFDLLEKLFGDLLPQ